MTSHQPTGTVVRRTLRQIPSRVSTVIGAVVVALLLSSCRVDILTTVSVTDNGSGLISVRANADAAVLQRAPELATSLNLDDLRTSGWKTTVEAPNVDGGMTVTLEHDFATPSEATRLLNDLSGPNGPFRNVELVRTGDANNATYRFDALIGAPNGLGSFADTEVLALLGTDPFADALATTGQPITDTLDLSLRITLPGSPASDGSDALPRDDDEPFTTFVWRVPLDGDSLVVSAITTDRNLGALLAGITASVLLVVLIVLGTVAVAYALWVVRRRTRVTPSP